MNRSEQFALKSRLSHAVSVAAGCLEQLEHQKHVAQLKAKQEPCELADRHQVERLSQFTAALQSGIALLAQTESHL